MIHTMPQQVGRYLQIHTTAEFEEIQHLNLTHMTLLVPYIVVGATMSYRGHSMELSVIYFSILYVVGDTANQYGGIK